MLTFKNKINNLTKAQLLGGWGAAKQTCYTPTGFAKKKSTKNNSD